MSSVTRSGANSSAANCGSWSRTTSSLVAPETDRLVTSTSRPVADCSFSATLGTYPRDTAVAPTPWAAESPSAT